MTLQPAQPTSAQLSTPTNTVRIEKLSDEENEEVDITDDLSNDEDGEHKPQVCQVAEVGEAGVESPTDSPAEEQREAGLTETLDTQSHALPSAQDPQPSSSLSCSEMVCVTGLVEKANGSVSTTQHLQTAAQLASEGTTEENEGSSSQSESSPHTAQLEDGTGKTDAFLRPLLVMVSPLFAHVKMRCIHLTDFAGKTEQGPTDRLEEEEEGEEEELKIPEQEIEMDMESITEDEKQAIPEFFEGRPSKTPERYLKIRNYILDQW